jgi:hypothetical protein
VPPLQLYSYQHHISRKVSAGLSITSEDRPVRVLIIVFNKVLFSGSNLLANKPNVNISILRRFSRVKIVIGF